MTARLNSTCSRTCQSSARATNRFTRWTTAFTSPGARGFTVPMLATFASAASRACSSGVRSGNGMSPTAAPFGLRARTRCRISAIIAASSSPFSSMFPVSILAPTGGDPGEHSAARRELAADSGRNRPARLHHILENSIDDVLLKDAEVAIGERVHLQRFQLQAKLVRHVAQRQLAVIGKSRLGTNRGELRHHDFDFITGILVLPGLDRRQLGVYAGARVLLGVVALHGAEAAAG